MSFSFLIFLSSCLTPKKSFYFFTPLLSPPLALFSPSLLAVFIPFTSVKIKKATDPHHRMHYKHRTCVFVCVCVCVCVCVREREREIDTSSLFLQNEFSLYMDENLLTFHDEGLVFCLFHKLYSSLKGFYGSCNSDERNLGSRLLLHL